MGNKVYETRVYYIDDDGEQKELFLGSREISETIEAIEEENINIYPKVLDSSLEGTFTAECDSSAVRRIVHNFLCNNWRKRHGMKVIRWNKINKLRLQKLKKLYLEEAEDES